VYGDEHVGNHTFASIHLLLEGHHTDTNLRSSTFGLINGGVAGLVWGYFIIWMGYFTVFASISELASM